MRVEDMPNTTQPGTDPLQHRYTLREQSLRALSNALYCLPIEWTQWMHMAVAATTREECQNVVASLQQAMGPGADAYATLLRIAHLLRQARDWQPAIRMAEIAREQEPCRTEAYEALMMIAMEARDYRRAVTVCRELLALAPYHLLAHDILGTAYIQMDNTDAAIRATDALIRLDPDSPAHHFKKALICQHKGEIALAVHEFHETIRLDTGGTYARAASEALEALDLFQLDQIVALATADRVFRMHLERSPIEAVLHRGYALSERGYRMLREIAIQLLPELPTPPMPLMYN
ncbi:MAG: tetratricopeptide repeat protein [Chloroherpetonaceae bacterium]|nr:tetratricopeptide repeat protein [Chthonomonadaceae bacterium]MDW8206564.1 tetratricopeptide repeat protein [Chloroherpetonaceae bacterium]